MILRTKSVREIIDDALVPWWTVSDQITDGIMRRCLVCGRCSEIMPGPTVAYVTHEPDCVVVTVNRKLAALAVDELPEPSLDVDRLSQATAAVVGWSDALDWHREWAVKVAAEYARLTMLARAAAALEEAIGS